MSRDRIGSYRVLDVVGTGGMATVVRGEHVATGAVVAIKTMPAPRSADLGFIRREIHALAQLRHPGIVRILDHGVDGGVPWYAMEYIAGPTLGRFRESVAATAGALDAMLGVVCRLCQPLAYLHGEGLVHRDLKPSNVIVSDDGAPVLVDFGVTTRFPGDRSREVLEIDAPTAGTVPYMAPEQVAGDRVDARADLYSLGCVLYQMVTGRPPFEGERYDEVARQHLLDPPRPPSALAPGLPAGLDDLILRLLAKHPQDRLGYASDVARALVALGARPGDDIERWPARTYLYLPRFVGRHLEMDELRRSHGELGRGRVILVGGDSGIGKTRLLLEFGRELRRAGAVVLEGDLHALIRFIADRCRRLRLAPGDPIGPKLRLLREYDASLASVPGLDRVPAPAELPAEAARTRLLSYLAETLELFAGRARICVLIDDLQWCDELTVGLLEFLLGADRLDRFPWLLVAAYRSHETTPALDRLAAHANVRSLPLPRIDEDAVGAIVGDMIGRGAAPPAFVEFLSTRSEGNPFFVAEYIRTAVAEAVLYRDPDGRWQVGGGEADTNTGDCTALPLPGSVAELVTARLATISASGLALTEVAAVLGRTFSVDLLADVAGHDEETFLSALEELLARQILAEEEADQLHFVHDHIRSGAYARIPQARRRAYHRAAAVTCERRAAEQGDELAGALGHHWERAGDPDRARPFHLRAARHAGSRHAHDQAAQAYAAYLALVAAPTPESIDARIELARDVLAIQTDFSGAREQLETAIDEARSVGARALEAAALVGLGKLYWRTGDMAMCERAAAEAAELAEQIGDRDNVANANERLAAVAWKQGRVERALEIHHGVLAARRQLGNVRKLATTLGNLGAILLVLERTVEAEAVLEEALRLFTSAPAASQSHASVLNNLAVAAIQNGRVERGYGLLEQAQVLLHMLGDRFTEPAPILELAILDRRAHGDLDAAERRIAEAEAVGQSVGDPVTRVHAASERGHIALARGESADAYFERAREIATALGAGAGSEAAQALDRLQRAQTAHATGAPLFRGECPEDIPRGLRAWLAARGQWS